MWYEVNMFLWYIVVGLRKGINRKKKIRRRNVERKMDEYHGKKYYVVVWNVLRDFRMIKYVG